MLKPLPRWAYLNTKFSFDDTESATAVEQTAMLYERIKDIITAYNEFEEQINTEIDNFTSSSNQTINEFTNRITSIMRNYISCIDSKIDSQDLVISQAIENQNQTIATAIEEQNTIIDEAKEYMETNIVSTTNTILNNSIANNEIILDAEYDSVTEELNLHFSKHPFYLTVTTTNCTIVVNRGDEVIIPNEDIIYKDDILSITITPDEGYEVSTSSVNENTSYESNNIVVDGNITIVAEATLIEEGA